MLRIIINDEYQQCLATDLSSSQRMFLTKPPP